MLIIEGNGETRGYCLFFSFFFFCDHEHRARDASNENGSVLSEWEAGEVVSDKGLPRFINSPSRRSRDVGVITDWRTLIENKARGVKVP